ncbi:hypothetical protein E4191_07730 [Paracoccus liaowanqingii]|uniref:Uncharacterized protein n=1 Tax=Paracoccus liaowanqingii TaxID=2560053 RepID=A0A4P7HKC4_9RHOB|nr:hypothetical protein [Paracoccus liaowanqingii]QBX34614.1 hypothetical protein E4191_07730 [Paracoccus liaowanqingii]
MSTRDIHLDIVRGRLIRRTIIGAFAGLAIVLALAWFITLAIIDGLSRSDWPAMCDGLTTAAECAARIVEAR